MRCKGQTVVNWQSLSNINLIISLFFFTKKQILCFLDMLIGLFSTCIFFNISKLAKHIDPFKEAYIKKRGVGCG